MDVVLGPQRLRPLRFLSRPHGMLARTMPPSPPLRCSLRRGARWVAWACVLAGSEGCSALYSFDEFTFSADAAVRADLPADTTFRDTATDHAPSIDDALAPDAPSIDDALAPEDAFSACPSGQALCEGGCVDLSNDPAHCGDCARTCVAPHAVGRCVAGGCFTRCEPEWGDCDGADANGCETDLRSPETCGACASSCAIGQSCGADGVCACPDGQSLCDSRCRDLLSDPTHCGGCFHACPAGTLCSGGACVARCTASQTLCAGACVSLASSIAHCGACDRPCTNAHGTQVCAGGSCYPVCSLGWGDCDGDRSNGCETDLRTDINCGACRRACGAGTVCTAGVCLNPCIPPRVLCGDGCVNLSNNNRNCGACGRTCDPSQRCVSSVCRACVVERSACVAGTICCAPLQCGTILGRSPYVGCCRPAGAACTVDSACCAPGTCRGGVCG